MTTKRPARRKTWRRNQHGGEITVVDFTRGIRDIFRRDGYYTVTRNNRPVCRVRVEKIDT